MITSIELQVISRIILSESQDEVSQLCAFDETYYSVFKDQILFILQHKQKHGKVPDVFTFQSEFPDISLVKVNEPYSYLASEMNKNKQHIILLETFNKIKDFGSGDVAEAWQYISNQCQRVSELSSGKPLDIIHDAQERSENVLRMSQQSRIPTGFDEIDKLMYGGLSTMEELLLIVARTNSGKSWICTKMMESAQKNGFPVLYYSPEMQASLLGTRFDTWRGHFQNSQLYQGKYTQDYIEYIANLECEDTAAFIVEDKDMPGGNVNVPSLEYIVKQQGVKLLIIDGLSYMSDTKRSDTDYTKYRNICWDLFKLSKKYGCAVVVAMQANRETKDIKDDKGEPFPNLYNVEGSDHPARIATQAFAVRQIFDKHVLDIRLEKSRTANNQKPVLSYAWDVNTGNIQYLPGGDDVSVQPVPTPSVQISSTPQVAPSGDVLAGDDIWDDDLEF